MDKKIVAVIAIGLLLFFVGCADVGEKKLTAEQIRDRSVEAMQNVDSYAFDMNMDMTMKVKGDESQMMGMKETKIAMTGNGKTDLENRKMHMEMDMDMLGMKVDMESYIIDNLQYIKMPMFGWVKNKTSADIWDKQNYAKFQSDLMRGIEVNKLEDEKVDENDCYVLSMKPDVKKIFELMNQQMGSDASTPDMEDLEAIKGVELREWIAKDNYLVMKMTMNMQMEKGGTLADMDMTMRLYDYNKPMEIVLPKEAESAVDMESIMKSVTGGLGAT